MNRIIINNQTKGNPSIGVGPETLANAVLCCVHLYADAMMPIQYRCREFSCRYSLEHQFRLFVELSRTREKGMRRALMCHIPRHIHLWNFINNCMYG